MNPNHSIKPGKTMERPEQNFPIRPLNFPILPLQIQLKVKKTFNLPKNEPDLTATLRGAFNAAFTQLFCEKPETNGICNHANCPLNDLNGHHWPIPELGSRKFASPPANLLFWFATPPVQPRSGGTLIFNLTVMGRGVAHLNKIIQATELLARDFLGPTHALELGEIRSLDKNLDPANRLWNPGISRIPEKANTFSFSDFLEESPPKKVQLNFAPLTLLKRKKEPLLLPSVPLFFERLWSRLELLARMNHEAGDFSFFTSDPGLDLNWAEYDLEKVIWNKPISPRTLTDSSLRLKERCLGFRGKMVLSGNDLEKTWPVLRLGQFVHLGKLTSFGLGRYWLEKM